MRAADIKKTINYFKKNGIKHTIYAAKERLEQQRENSYDYNNEKPTKEELDKQRFKANQYSVVISIVVPTYLTKKKYLEELLESVENQTYDKWELVIVDASPDNSVKEILDAYTVNWKQEKLQYIHLEKNQSIAENTNVGILAAKGDYICLTDHDDLLTYDALFHLARIIEEKKASGNLSYALVYSDEDKWDDVNQRYYDVNRKGKFNYDLILSNNYICHITCVRQDIMKKLGERSEFDGAQDYDLVLQIMNYLEENGVKTVDLAERVGYVNRVLYHWRSHPDSTAENTNSKLYAYDNGKRALQHYYMGRGINAQVNHSLHLGFYHTEYGTDLFEKREDIGIVGGRILNKNHMTECIYQYEDNVLKPMFVGLHKEYSGLMHRFSLRQDVDVVDLRHAYIAPGMRNLLEGECGVPFVGDEKTGRLDVTTFEANYRKVHHEHPDWKKLSISFCKLVQENHLFVVYDPNK